MSKTTPVSDYSSALIEGPWRHEFVGASGTRLHLALAGPKRPAEISLHRRAPARPDADRPLVVLLHGAGQFWWAWRNQIPALAKAGYPVAALDLRGVAASDKPPNGYDIPTRSRDVAAVVRSLGYETAIVIGHGTGGETAWAMPTLQPAVTLAIAALASPHPARVHASLRQVATPTARRYLAFAQTPMLPERRLRDSDLLSEILNAGAATPLPEDDLAVYETGIRIPFAAHTSTEPLRWAVRSRFRGDRHRYRTAVRTGIDVPALQIQGTRDGFLNCDHVDLDARAFCRELAYHRIENAGHYLPEEAPDQVNEVLLDWLGGLAHSGG